MGKVTINESDATKTARNGSSTPSQRDSSRSQRAHIDVSQSKSGTNTNKKSKSTDKADSAKTPSAKASSSKAKAIAVVSKDSDVSAQSPKSKSPSAKSTKPASSRRLKVSDSSADTAKKEKENSSKSKPVPKSPQISRYAKPKSSKPAASVRIVAKDTPLRLEADNNNPAKAPETETGLVVREVDPEIALLASRSRSMEHPRPDTLRAATPAPSRRRSMSGFLSETPRPAQHISAPTNHAASPEAEPRFSRAKSMLIGVGVALIVAIVGFAGIAIFGGGKNKCTVHFDANGGTQVEGTEFVCGRKVVQPEDPEKDGFTFAGWMLEGELFDFSSTPIYKNSTLVAKWQANDGTEVVTISFDTDGGAAMVRTRYDSLLYRSGERHGYRFADGAVRRAAIVGTEPSGRLVMEFDDGEKGSFAFGEAEFLLKNAEL